MLFYQFFKLQLLKSQFRAMKPAIQKRVLRATARAGAGVLKKAYKLQLRPYRRTKSLEKTLAVRVLVFQDGNVTGYAGVKRKKEYRDASGRRIVPEFYNHFLELGRAAFQRKLLRKNPRTPFRNGLPRYVPAESGKYPLKKAIAASKGAVDAKVQETFAKRMEAEAAKVAAQAAGGS